MKHKHSMKDLLGSFPIFHTKILYMTKYLLMQYYSYKKKRMDAGYAELSIK